MRQATLLVLAVVLALPAAAAELEGVQLPDQVTVSGRTLVLNGLGLREATVLMVNVYVAGLYVEARSSDPAAILEPAQPKRLVMKFVRSVGKEKLAEAFTEGFDKNAGDGRAAIAPGLAALNAAMADVKKEDVIVLTYLPDTGVTVSVKGKDSAVIPGADFQRVLFSIWLGANPPNVSLREGLLGRAAKN
jgi:chalcone isomerase-like protein